jgi:calcium-dependent protein kinase
LYQTAIFRAVKIIKKHKNPQSQASASTAYTREVSSLKQLQHPHIVSMIDAYETAEDFVIVTEHCSGGSIYNWFEQHPDLWTEQTIARLAKQLLQALLFCHKKNIVHRDIKPANFAMSSTKSDAGNLLRFAC